MAHTGGLEVMCESIGVLLPRAFSRTSPQASKGKLSSGGCTDRSTTPSKYAASSENGEVPIVIASFNGQQEAETHSVVGSFGYYCDRHSIRSRKGSWEKFVSKYDAMHDGSVAERKA